MRIRDHNKGDLALAALTVSVAAAAAVSEVVRRVGGGRRRREAPLHRVPPQSPRAR